MGHFLIATILAGAALGVAGLSEPESAAPESKDRPHARFRIISEHAELTPGATETLGLVFTMDPHWHVYYKGAPGGGNPPEIEESKLPPGYSLGEIQWPAPKRYVAPGGIYDSVYEQEVTLLVPLHVPAGAKAGDKVKIGLKLNWLECSDVCVFGSGQDEKSMSVGSAKPSRSSDASLIEKSRTLLPKPWPAEGGSAELQGGVLTIQVPGASRLEFYPGPQCSDIEKLVESTVTESETMTIRFVNANKVQVQADGILGVWRSGSPSPAYFTVKKTSSD